MRTCCGMTQFRIHENEMKWYEIPNRPIATNLSVILNENMPKQNLKYFVSFIADNCLNSQFKGRKKHFVRQRVLEKS